MDKKKQKNEIIPEIESQGKKITRKDAIKKMGYFALSASTMMILLGKPEKANAQTSSPPPPTTW